MNLPFIMFITFVVIFAICFVLKYVGVKKILGKDLWYKNGYQFTSDSIESENKVPFDKYTLTHVTSGLCYYIVGKLLGLSGNKLLIFVLGMASLWELIENTDAIIYLFRKDYPNYTGDSWVNIIVDVFGALVAFNLASRFKQDLGSLLTLVFFFEALTLTLSHDSICYGVWKFVVNTPRLKKGDRGKGEGKWKANVVLPMPA